MEKYRLSDVAYIQTGLVLTRKASKDKYSEYKYKRLTLKAVTENGSLDKCSVEKYSACEVLDRQFLTSENDILVRLFSPIKASLIKAENTNLVIPSQLAIVRLKQNSPFLPGYISAYISNNRYIENMIEGAGAQDQKIIRVGSVAELEIPFIPKDKQRLVADINEKQLELTAMYKTLVEAETLRAKTIISEIIGGKR